MSKFGNFFGFAIGVAIAFNSSSARCGELPMVQLARTSLQTIVYRDGRDVRSAQIRQQDELWIVDARQSHCAPADLSLVRVKQYVGGAWVQSSLDELAISHSNDRSRSTVMHVHGWRTDPQASIRQSMDIYNNVTRGCDSAPAMRWVLWQWNSDKNKVRFKTDYVQKSKRALTVSLTLAKTLNRLGDRRVTLLGHSLGATVILSAMTRSADLPSSPDQYRVAMVAAAIGCDLGGQLARCQVGAQPQVEETLVVHNRTDRVLLLGNQIICRKTLGCGGFSLWNLLSKQTSLLGRLSWNEVATQIGPVHDGRFYTATRAFKENFVRLLHATSAVVK